MVTICYLGFIALSFIAAVYDFLFYRIPNLLVGLIFAGSLLKLCLDYSTTDFYLTGFIFLITLLTGYLLYASKLMGAGDAKFLSVSVLWIEPLDVLAYLVLVAVAGGLLALICVMGHDRIDFIRLKILTFLKNKGSISLIDKAFKSYHELPFANVRNLTWRKTLVPYGVAIFGGSSVFVYHYLVKWGFR